MSTTIVVQKFMDDGDYSVGVSFQQMGTAPSALTYTMLQNGYATFSVTMGTTYVLQTNTTTDQIY